MMFKILYTLFCAWTVQVAPYQTDIDNMENMPHNYYQIVFPKYYNQDIYQSTLSLSHLYTSKYTAKGYRYICYYNNNRIYLTLSPKTLYFFSESEIIGIGPILQCKLLLKSYYTYNVNKRYLIKTYALINSGQLIFAKERLKNIKYLYNYLEHYQDGLYKNESIIIKDSYDFLKAYYNKKLAQQQRLQKYDKMARRHITNP